MLSLKKIYINSSEMASVLQVLCIAVGKPVPLHFFLQKGGKVTEEKAGFFSLLFSDLN